ncbi:MAG TPA: signal peptidase II [Acidimicrobiales bacterium]|nr:signal peptidase II [Acidimicrobiales bacterium]
MNRRRFLLAAVIVAAILVVDQTTKTWAVNALDDGPVDVFWTLRFNLSFNSGFAFSMGTGLTPLITVAAIVLVGALIAFARHATSPLLSVALGMLLGGAMGNLADRLFRGHDGAVVDFIDFQWWPVFNVADIGISVGAVLMIVASVIDERREREQRTPADA